VRCPSRLGELRGYIVRLIANARHADALVGAGLTAPIPSPPMGEGEGEGETYRLQNARPNLGHHALVALERMGQPRT
jgi:hypothetical protein